MTSTEPTRPAGDLQLAGMALRNGVLMLGPTSWAVAVRDRSGDVRVTSAPRPNGGARIAARIPLLRGPLGLANMLRVLPSVRSAAPGARLGPESPLVLATLIAGSVSGSWIRRRTRSVTLAELATGGLSLAMTLATLRTGEVAAYHGAEHKAIGGYERGISAAEAPRQHPRCGTQLAIPMLVFSALATQLALRVAPRHPREARVAGQVLGIAAATELFRAGARGHGTPVAVAAAKAGLALQTHATTVEPTREQLDVAEAALDALLSVESQAAAYSLR